MQKTLYVGLDVHKATISVTTAADGREGEVQFVGTVPNNPADVAKLAQRLAKKGLRLEFCYEAGPCGYGLHRQLTGLGHGCTVAAPSMMATKPGERIKTDRRDSQKLAIQHRSGDVTAVWVPDEIHEAMRDLVRARLDAVMQLMRARQQLLAFLLRHGRIYETGKHWTLRHRQWLAKQAFEQEAHQIVFQDYVEAVRTAQDRRDQLEARIAVTTATWSLMPLVDALRALRGLDFIAAVTFVAAVGDLRRFETARELMAYLGLVHRSNRVASECIGVASRRRATGKPGECWSRLPGVTAIRRASRWRRAALSTGSRNPFAILPGRRRPDSAGGTACSAAKGSD
jgi:transposase